MDDIRLEKRTIQERLIIAKTLIETALSDLPTADLSEYSDKLWKTAYERGKAEARPRTGKWLMVEDADEDGNARYECSLCHAGETHTPRVKVSYCWNCGARMTEESK